MPEHCEDALRAERTAWEAVADLARQQRAALLRREAQSMNDLREPLQAQLGAALAARQRSFECRDSRPEEQQAALQRDVDDALQGAHDAIRLNLELLRDVCSYLQMLRSAIVCESTPEGYGQGRPARAAISRQSRVA